MLCEYNECPVCGKERDGNKICAKCGFEYIPIDIEGGSDIEIVRKAREQRKKWSNSLWFKLALALIIGLSIGAIYGIADNSNDFYDEFNYGDFYIKFLVTSAIITFLSWLIIISKYLQNTDATFLGLRNRTIEQHKKSIQIQEAQEQERMRKEKQQQIAEREVRRKQKELDDFSNKYGGISKTIIMDKFRSDFQIYSDIALFETTKIISICGDVYKYSDIISCELEDDVNVIKGKIHTTSRLSTTDGILSGIEMMAGKKDWATAIGTTGDRVETTYTEPDKVFHRYRIHINVNNIEKPIITLRLGDNQDFARSLNALINVVIIQGKS